MRHFIVLGFSTNSKKGQGEVLYLGPDRSKAIEVVNDATGQEIRRELYELAVPQIRRHMVKPVAKDAEAPPTANELYEQYEPDVPPSSLAVDSGSKKAKAKAAKQTGAKK